MCAGITLKVLWRDGSIFLQGGLHLFGNEAGKGLEIKVDAGTIKNLQILCAVVNWNDCPGIATRCEKHIHQETSHSAIAVWIGMDIAKKPVSKYGPHRSFRFFLDQME